MSPDGFADIILTGGNLINVLTREIYKADLAIKDEYILLCGDCSSVQGARTQMIDVSGKYLSPGFIDPHMHFESAMLTVTEFSKLSILGGTTSLFADPHEIGNVLGVEGMQAMVDEARGLPNRVMFTVPCLVPDVPGLETAGREVNSDNITSLLHDPLVAGLGEMQGFSNTKPVYEKSPALIDDLMTSVLYTQKLGKTVEGNAPSLFGADLAAHIILCGNHTSCHETTTKEECMEKIRNGMTVFMRQGSTQKNMAECVRAITEEGMDSRTLVLATDDMVAEDLLKTGHMNQLIAETIAQGIDPVEAIQMATINPATHYNRKDIGVLAPGKAADICVIDDLMAMQIDKVFVAGKQMSDGGKLLVDLPSYQYPESVKHSVKRKKLKMEDIVVAATRQSHRVRAIAVIEDQNLTGCVEATMQAVDGVIAPDLNQDLLPMLCVERHGKSDRIGKTFLQGMGMKAGAIAQTIGHDTHHIMACGANYEDLLLAINRVIAMEGGIAMVKDHKVLGDLPLPVAGLITDQMDGKTLCDRLQTMHKLAETELSCAIHSPFMHLSFLSLVTSPEWKLSDMGLIDATSYEILPTLLD